ncbi:ribonucleoside triphosphate reductase [Candidatus Babeliales bacterium]|nr:ribonucleoside triphosphate reductase [Candidatus Babeliales bacterium]
MIQFIQKKDSTIVAFDKGKIFKSIRKALVATEEDFTKAEIIANKTVFALEEQFEKLRQNLTIQNIRECVECSLTKEGFRPAARLYKDYNRKVKQISNSKDVLKEASVLVDNYLGGADWKVKENSHMGHSLQGLNNYVFSNIAASYWLNKIYDEEIKKTHESGEFHIHDLSCLGAYCVGWDLYDLLVLGFGGVQGKTESGPPKHLRTALGQIVNFFYTLQGEAAGAQAFSSFDTLLAPFVRYDNLSYKEVKQTMQEFLFNANVPTRVGFQTPFTNLTMDLCPPSTFAETPVIIGGKPQKETYGEFQQEMNMINTAFCEVMMEGDYKGRIFTFPIPTYNLTKDFNWDDPGLDLLWKMTAKYGVPYFSNFINSDLNPEDARSMCCRLRLDNRELRKRGGGLFGSNPMTGSIGVVTLNLSRAAYVSKGSKEEFFSELDRLLKIARRSLNIKRKNVELLTEKGLYPYARRYLSKIKEGKGEYWTNHFNTIGILGMNEAMLNLLGVSIASKEGKELAIESLKYLRERLVEFQVEDGQLYNLEATPGEGTTYRFGKKDQAAFPDIISSGNHEPYYTNSTHLPVGFTSDIFEALNHQDELQSLYTGGTVLHGFIGEKIDDFRVAKKLVKTIAENYRLPYFTLTPTFSICPVHGYIKGEHRTCPLDS